jgi:serine protease
MTLMNPPKHLVHGNLFALLAGVALLSSGCVGAPEGSEEDVDSTESSFEAFEAHAFKEPESGVYIVNGDTPVTDTKHLREFYEQYVQKGALIVDRSGGVDDKWSDVQKLNLTYCVSTSFGSHYNAVVTAMAQATAAWKAATNINYVYVSAQDSNCTKSNNNVVFDVNPVNVNGQYLARSFFPNTPRSTRNVLIDNTAFTSAAPPTLTGILRHELGHTLGFRHEHTRPEAGTCFEDNNWRALTTYDSASVMHYPQCNGTGDWTLVLTQKDITGAVSLYGNPGGGGNPPPPPPPSGGTPSSATASGSVAAGKNVNYNPITVLAGTDFKVVMTGTGDPDLYVKFGSAPTTASYTCRPYLDGPNEACTVTVPAGQSAAYIMVHGYAKSTYNLAINYTAP